MKTKLFSFLLAVAATLLSACAVDDGDATAAMYENGLEHSAAAVFDGYWLIGDEQQQAGRAIIGDSLRLTDFPAAALARKVFGGEVLGYGEAPQAYHAVFTVALASVGYSSSANYSMLRSEGYAQRFSLQQTAAVDAAVGTDYLFTVGYDSQRSVAAVSDDGDWFHCTFVLNQMELCQQATGRLWRSTAEVAVSFISTRKL